MSRLCWVIVLLAVAVVRSDARNDQKMDCQEWQAAGYYTTDVYTVWLGGNAVRVRCDMDTDGGGWTVIQLRGNFSHQQIFNWNWKEYKNGIGRVEKDFWLGNDNIFALSNQGNYSLRMDMTAADGDSAYALFQEFRVENEKANYTLHLSGYSGTAGDSMTGYNNMMFSTRDRGDQRRCAEGMKGGFWYYGCGFCNPNGEYMPGKQDGSAMYYDSFKNGVGLFSLDMKIRRHFERTH